ncbi:MAG: hypothetical protein ACOVOQ_05315 [Flavobacterium sp.]
MQQKINAAWLVAYTALWNGTVFSTTEQQQTKQLIEQFLQANTDTNAAYNAFVQRVLMARMYIQKNHKALAVTPTEWLATNNNNGFVGTATWYTQLQEKRQAMPLYRLELKAFAEAILDMEEEPTARNFHYWRSYFIERNHQGLLNLFLSCIGNKMLG